MKSNIPAGVTQDMIDSLFHRNEDGRRMAVTLACVAYCDYYRDNAEKKACEGLCAVTKGISKGMIGPAQISHLLDIVPGSARRAGCLINELCSKCAYIDRDCDFMSPSPPPDATPCGGYRFLQALLDARALTPDVVRTLIQDS